MADAAEENYNPETEIEIGNFKVMDLQKIDQVQQENTTLLFKARTKIYIWDSDSKEWKERGLGNISIIKNEDD